MRRIITIFFIFILLIFSTTASATPIGAPIKLLEKIEADTNSSDTLASEGINSSSITVQVAQPAAIDYKWDIHDLCWKLTSESRNYSKLTFVNTGAEDVLANISYQSESNELLNVSGLSATQDGVASASLSITLPAGKTTSVYLLYTPQPPNGATEFTLTTTVNYSFSAVSPTPAPTDETGGTGQ